MSVPVGVLDGSGIDQSDAVFVTTSIGPTPALKLAPLAGPDRSRGARQPRSDKLFWPHPERVGSLAVGRGRSGSVKHIGSGLDDGPRQPGGPQDLDPCSIRD